MKENKMQKDAVKNQRIDHNVIKSYDELLRDEYAQTLDAVIDSTIDYPHSSLPNNSIISSSYSKPANSYSNNISKEDLEKKKQTGDSPQDVAQKFIDRTQFPL